MKDLQLPRSKQDEFTSVHVPLNTEEELLSLIIPLAHRSVLFRT